MDRMVFLATPARICIVWVSRTNLGYGNVECEKILRAAVLSLACHDDLLCGWFAVQNPITKSIGPGFDRPLCRQPNRSPYGGDYRVCASEIKLNFRHSARLPRAPAARSAAVRPQPMVGVTNPKRNREWVEFRSWAVLRPSVPGISRPGPCTRSRTPRRTR